MGGNIRVAGCNVAKRVMGALSRTKTFETDGVEKSELARVLGVVDLTALGVGSTLGLGVYLLAGSVARNEAGPAVTLSFLVAAVASAFAGLCYAEFAARVPRAGSAYVYSYVSVGELVAFVIGWNLILEYVIGTASVARGLSSYIDALTNFTMRNTLIEAMPMKLDFLSKYPDWFSFGIIMLLAGLLSIGVRESSFLNNIFTALNLIVIVIVIVAGSIYADVNYWKILKKDIPAKFPNAGEGGFLPFGIGGMMAGAAKCFYGFVGFDCVATTGEEAKNPQKNIPLAIVISLIIIFLAYFSISTVLTMMWPYYDQNPDAPFPYVFDKIGLYVIKWIVTVGAIFALCTSLLGAMFPLPRILYAMANDGLLFPFFAKVHPRSQTPIVATLLSGLFAGLMAMIFDLDQLINMMSIGTLLAYTIVAICVLILRYEDPPDSGEEFSYKDIPLEDKKRSNSVMDIVKQLFNLSMMKYPSTASSAISRWGVVVYSIFTLGFCACIIYAGHMLENRVPWAIAVTSLLGVVMLIILVIIGRQPHSSLKLSFKVPLVPLVPGLSVLINVYLMLELDANTWIRFGVWMLIGFSIYFFYGLFHSKEGQKSQNVCNGVGDVHSMNTLSMDEQAKSVEPEHSDTTKC